MVGYDIAKIKLKLIEILIRQTKLAYLVYDELDIFFEDLDTSDIDEIIDIIEKIWDEIKTTVEPRAYKNCLIFISKINAYREYAWDKEHNMIGE